MKKYDPTDERRPLFDWVIFTLIHVIVIVAIAIVGMKVYGEKLGFWVGASAAVAGLTSTYLFAKIVPGETFMKVILGLAVAANAGYLVHNGAQAIGVELYNAAQVKKYEIAMAQAAQAKTRSVARAIGMDAKAAAEIEKAFGNEVAIIAAILAFLELSLAIMFFSIASKRVAQVKRSHDESTEQPSRQQIGLSPPAPVTAQKRSSNFYDPTSGKS